MIMSFAVDIKQTRLADVTRQGGKVFTFTIWALEPADYESIPAPYDCNVPIDAKNSPCTGAPRSKRR